MQRRYQQMSVLGAVFHKSGGFLSFPSMGDPWFVDGYEGRDANGSGANDPSRPLATMAEVGARVRSNDVICFRGKIAEEVIFSNLVFDVTVLGMGSLHHADQPGSGSTAVHTGGAVWQPPASPTATTPLAEVRGRGWRFMNILFDCPVDSAGLQFVVNGGDGLTEYSASHYTVEGCDFRNGLYGIQDKGGCFNGLIRGNVFETLDATASGCAIIATNVVNAWRRHRILDNFFQPDCDSVSGTAGNERHIVGAFNGAQIMGNTFGKVKGTGKYIDLTGGTDNVVANNVLGGVYDTSDYVSGTGDLWYQNAVAVKATTAPDGLSLAVPGA